MALVVAGAGADVVVRFVDVLAGAVVAFVVVRVVAGACVVVVSTGTGAGTEAAAVAVGVAGGVTGTAVGVTDGDTVAITVTYVGVGTTSTWGGRHSPAAAADANAATSASTLPPMIAERNRIARGPRLFCRAAHRASCSAIRLIAARPAVPRSPRRSLHTPSGWQASTPTTVSAELRGCADRPGPP